MRRDTLESLVAFHCAPTLAGIKAANLFSRRTDKERVDGDADEMRVQLAPYRISMEVLCKCETHELIFVYREDMLRKLFTAQVERFLEGYGYPVGASVAEKLAALKRRLAARGEFPHEIGVFLGYPLEDVKGFIENRGNGCKACGTWKVYGDSESATALFVRYKKCTDYFCKKLEAGYELAQLLRAAPSFS